MSLLYCSFASSEQRDWTGKMRLPTQNLTRHYFRHSDIFSANIH